MDSEKPSRRERVAVEPVRRSIHEIVADIRFQRMGGDAALKQEQLLALRAEREAAERETAKQSKGGRPTKTLAVMAEYDRRPDLHTLPAEAVGRLLEEWRPRNAKHYPKPGWDTIAKAVRKRRTRKP